MADWIGVTSARLSAARPGRKATSRREDTAAAPVVVVVDDLAHEPAFRIGVLEVRPATREVIVGERREVLEPRVMQVLVVLAYSVGEVVSRDDLFRTCWAGRIVGEDAINRAVAGVRRVGERLGGFKVVTVARVGYRLDVADAARPRARLAPALLESLLPLLAGVAVLVGDSVHPWRARHAAPPVVSEAGLALRPLSALGSQPQVRQLADGVRDSVVAALPTTRIRVLAPGEAATDTAAAPLLLDGAVSEEAGKLRVNVHLDDARSHVTIWSRDFEGSAADAAVLRARAATRVAYASECAREAFKPPHGTSEPGLLRRWMHACDLFADWKINGGPDMRDGFEWIETLRGLTAAAPDFTPPHDELAVGAAYISRSAPPEQAAALRRESETHAQRALELDPNASAPWVARQLQLPTLRWAEREQLLRKGLTADAKGTDAGPWLGLLLADVGRMKEANLERASASNAVELSWGPTGAWAACLTAPSKEAVQRGARVQAMMPESVLAWRINYGCRLYAGQWAAAHAAYHAPPGPTGVAPYDAMLDAYFAAAQTRAPADAARARRLAVSLGEQSAEARMDAISVLASLGFVDDAFALAARIDPVKLEPSPATVSLLFTPLTASMHRKPLSMALAQRLGLVDYWRTTGHWPDFCAEPSLPYDCKAEAARLAPWAKAPSR